MVWVRASGIHRVPGAASPHHENPFEKHRPHRARTSGETGAGPRGVMSFSLYIGTDVPLRTIVPAEHGAGFHTRELLEREWPISIRLRKIYHKYAGAAHGHGFRHWMPVEGETQPNHRALHALLAEVPGISPDVEIYTCRDGDFMRPCEGHVLVPLDRLLEPEFHFRERYLYTVIRA